MERKYESFNVNDQLGRTFSQTVKEIVETLIKPDCLRQDLLFALLLIIMKENDFVQLKGIGKKSISVKDYFMSRKQKDFEMYESVFILNGFQDTPLKIIACPLNDTILINATIPELYKETYSICFNLSKYVVYSELGIPANFSNLDELYVTFKDRILSPIKSSILNFYRFPSANLSRLPEDVLRQIILKLSVKDIVALSKSCKRIHAIVNNERLWSELFKRDFQDKYETGGTEWHVTYKEQYKLNQEANIRQASNLRSFSFQQSTQSRDYMRHVSDSRRELIL
ncbi:F-box only protein 7 [Aphomia sociella]